MADLDRTPEQEQAIIDHEIRRAGSALCLETSQQLLARGREAICELDQNFIGRPSSFLVTIGSQPPAPPFKWTERCAQCGAPVRVIGVGEPTALSVYDAREMEIRFADTSDQEPAALYRRVVQFTSEAAELAERAERMLAHADSLADRIVGVASAEPLERLD